MGPISPERNAVEKKVDLVVGLIRRLSGGSRGRMEVVMVEARRQELRRKSIHIYCGAPKDAPGI